MRVSPAAHRAVRAGAAGPQTQCLGGVAPLAGQATGPGRCPSWLTCRFAQSLGPAAPEAAALLSSSLGAPVRPKAVQQRPATARSPRHGPAIHWHPLPERQRRPPGSPRLWDCAGELGCSLLLRGLRCCMLHASVSAAAASGACLFVPNSILQAALGDVRCMQALRRCGGSHRPSTPCMCGPGQQHQRDRQPSCTLCSLSVPADEALQLGLDCNWLISSSVATSMSAQPRPNLLRVDSPPKRRPEFDLTYDTMHSARRAQTSRRRGRSNRLHQQRVCCAVCSHPRIHEGADGQPACCWPCWLPG